MDVDLARRTLGVGPAAGPATVNAAYRRLARRLHPDLNRAPDASRCMGELNRAYELLRDRRGRPAQPAPGADLFWSTCVPETGQAEPARGERTSGLRAVARLLPWALLLTVVTALAVLTFRSGVLTLAGAGIVLAFAGRRARSCS
jgi:hypothetical protein